MRPEEYNTLRECETSHWWYTVLHRLVLTELRRSIPAGAEVLDAGCGTGGMLSQLRQWHATGIDISHSALDHCRQRGQANVAQGSVNSLPFADESFACVLALDVLYHSDVDESLALAELVRVLKPEGTLILNLAAFELLRGSHDAAVHGRRRYRANRVRTLLEANGLQLRVCHYWNAWLFLPLLIKRKLWSSDRSDTTMPGPFINNILSLAGRLDANFCRTLRVPFGTSLFAVASKPRRLIGQ